MKYVLLVSLMDSITFNSLIKLLNITNITDILSITSISSILNISSIIPKLIYYSIMFIPFSFAYELLFDLLHYATHLLLHKNKMLYIYHKTHHSISHPSSIYAFYQHPVDYFITNIIPLTITTYFMQPYSLFIFILLIHYSIVFEYLAHLALI